MKPLHDLNIETMLQLQPHCKLDMLWDLKVTITITSHNHKKQLQQFARYEVTMEACFRHRKKKKKKDFLSFYQKKILEIAS